MRMEAADSMSTPRARNASFDHARDPQPEGHMASHIGRRKLLATLGGSMAARGARAASGDADERVPERPPPSVTAHPMSDHSTPWLSFDVALIRGLTVISIS